MKGLPDETLAKFLTNVFEVILKVLLVISVAKMIGIETT
jgi:small conductance mechanosensitive channel